MSPDPKSPRKPRAGSRPPLGAKIAPSKDDPFEIAFFRRHKDDDQKESTPGRDFLNSCPPNVRAKFQAILIAIATAPPHRYSGGGNWEAMHGDMGGYFEVRTDGPQRRHYRLFCRLDSEAQDRTALLTIITGGSKAFKTEFSNAFYKSVRKLGDEYLARNPRSLV
jgi:hypothetical protein